MKVSTPYEANIFKRIIEIRQVLKKHAGMLHDGSEKDELETAQYMLKILANAGGYGIFVELVEHKLSRLRGTKPDAAINEEGEGPLKQHWTNRVCYSGDSSFFTEVTSDEKPGRFFPSVNGGF